MNGVCPLDERLAKSTSEKLERIKPQIQITPSGVQWFDLGVVFPSIDWRNFHRLKFNGCCSQVKVTPA